MTLAPGVPAWQRRGMSLHRSLFPLAALGLMAGCGGSTSPEIAEQGGEPIECALAGAESFERSCMLDRGPDQKQILVRHPDGGFRRFAETGDGMWQTVDGAQEVRAERMVDKGLTLLEIGDDRYRLPATGMAETSDD